MTDPVANWAQAQAQREADLLEQAVELALQQGTCGVLVTRGFGTFEAAPDPSVPYGWIYQRTAAS